MARAKYVVIDNGGLGGEEIFIFPAFKPHVEMRVLGNIISAGFVSPNNAMKCGFYTHGESIGLKIKSREQDQILLEMLLKDEWA